MSAPDFDKSLQEYRLDQLETEVAEIKSILSKLVLELEAGKKGAKWLIGIAFAVGSFVTWIVKTFGIHIGGGGQ